MAIIPRRELENVLSDYRWLLIYGRRKTGKTFYVREKGEYDRYLIVTRNKTLIDIDRGEEFSQREFQKILPLLIREERIVIDEFHRLDEPVFSTLQALSGRGRMILNNINNALLQKSCQEPLFGLFELREVGLVDPRDAILFARELGLKGRKLLEVACIAREP